MLKHLTGLLLIWILIAGAPVCAQLPQRVSDLNPLQLSSNPRNLTSFNNRLYFSADDGNIGRELWSYDGSMNQPVLVADLAPGLASGVPTFGGFVSDQSFPVLNGKMYFLGYPSSASGYTRLHRYDGVNPPILAPGIADTVFFGLSDFITFGNRIFFAAGTPTTGTELYAYDGLSAGTVYEINPNSSSSPHAFTVFNGKLYFVATGDVATLGEELYVYDPATNECSLAADINPGPVGSSCWGLTVAGNMLYFTATISGYGSELCQFDGTTVTRLSDLAPGANNGVGITSAYYQGNIIFAGSTDASDYRPYKYNISTGRIERVSGDSTINGLGWAAEYRGNLYLSCAKGLFPLTLGSELWKFDGANLSMLPEIWPGRYPARPDNYHVHNGYLYFTAADSTYGTELYRLHDQTGIINTRFDGEMKIFPNPAESYATLELTLKSAQRLSLSISDMTGKEVYTTGIRAFGSGRNEIVIPLQSFACGSYSYQLLDSAGLGMTGGILIKE